MVTAWFYLAHASAGLSTVLSVGAAFVSLAKLCAQGEGGDVTGSGVLGLIAGLLGIATGLMFHLKPLAVMLVLTLAGEKGWAFYLFSAGSLVLAVFGLVLLALPNTKSRAVQPM
ncbi:hypothetical protein BaRGS_00033549 [Batillaria attramentaria]|uniref:Uncharacterized protein n=1 Tax=Batillaria attramentaria TaxID=370345 RepID=A0ABD0JJI8_9CAEN|nr:hypothetical protein BaRGS_005069 [Batillaria attramentaria]